MRGLWLRSVAGGWWKKAGKGVREHFRLKRHATEGRTRKCSLTPFPVALARLDRQAVLFARKILQPCRIAIGVDGAFGNAIAYEAQTFGRHRAVERALVVEIPLHVQGDATTGLRRHHQIHALHAGPAAEVARLRLRAIRCRRGGGRGVRIRIVVARHRIGGRRSGRRGLLRRRRRIACRLAIGTGSKRRNDEQQGKCLHDELRWMRQDLTCLQPTDAGVEVAGLCPSAGKRPDCVLPAE